MPQLGGTVNGNGRDLGLIDRPGAGSFSPALKPIWFLILGVCIFMPGCKSAETIWSTDSRSPDGNVIASARTVARNKGLSVISGVDTSVSLNWATGSKHPTSILELADGSDAPADTTVEMNWLTPTHLELAYKGNQTVVFQAVKWVGIDITVRDLAGPSSTSALR
jgi:hypothetical protein